MSKAKMQTPDDYAIERSPQPTQNPLTVHSKLVSPNRFQILDNFPPISYSQIMRAPSPAIPNPSFPNTPSKQELPNSQKYSQKPVYTPKPNIEHITLTTFTSMQDLSTLSRIVSGFFPAEFCWYPEDTNKTQKFYEYILVDSKSVEISHSMDPSNPSRIAFSKCIIKKVFKSEEWPSGPFSRKNFSKKFIPNSYSYPDYRQAWSRAFFKRSFNHSWFFSFHPDFIKNLFPIWFLTWWFDFGPIKSIMPQEVSSALEFYTKNSAGDLYKRELLFFAEFRVPWIMCWTFTFRQHFPLPYPLSLVREFRVKWWPNYSTKYCNIQVVKNFLQTGENSKWENPGNITQKNIITESSNHMKKNEEVIQSSPSLSSAQMKLFQTLEADPETASQYLEFIKAKKSINSDKESSDGSSATDPYGGQFAQDPFDFMM